MAEDTVVIPASCPTNAEGMHSPSAPTWNDRVQAQVITCGACGKQWIFRSRVEQ